MRVSCYCCTYGRPPRVLAEAVESFLRQDFQGEAELVILNDLAGQKLTLDPARVPAGRAVRVINCDDRCPSLGYKFRMAVGLCRGEILLPWEDDDIFLPWRISWSLANLRDGYYHTNRAWYEHGGPGILVPTTNLFHCNMAFTKALYAQVGGYDRDDTAALDQSLFCRLTAAGAKGMDTPWSDVHYIYRWQHSGSWHGSGMDGAPPTEEAARRVATDIARGSVPMGEVEIKPAWLRDWTALAAKAAKLKQQEESTHGSA